MIEERDQRVHRLRDAFMIVDPTNRGIDLTLDRDGDFEAMAMHAAAFMIRRQGRQSMCRFEVKFFSETGAHDSDARSLADPSDFSTDILTR